MDLNELKNKVSLDFAAEPQKEAKGQQAVASIQAGISELSALGYRYALVEEFGTHEAPVPQEYPKMLYRVGQYPTELTVGNEMEEAEAAKDGYASRVPADVAAVEAASKVPPVTQVAAAAQAKGAIPPTVAQASSSI